MSAVIEINASIQKIKGKRVVNEAAAKWSSLLEKVALHSDRYAFQQLFAHFSPLIKAFANKQAGASRGENFSEEIVQETMIKVWQKAASFNVEKANASTWIFTIARNTRIDLLRKNARHFQNKASSDQYEDAFDVDDIWIENENEDVFNQLAKQRNSEMLNESMKALPEEQSLILRKVYLEDKSHSEIAEELELPLGTVKSRVRLALNKLSLSVDR
ncbi:sigma-70 family RNA polymerase sigma factor [Gammaproteobacteria bacterium]|nr:sigma-70 family RNA polymerase sigma factor [Gammaproteobacteria bacterium]